MRTLDELMDALELSVQLDEKKGATTFVDTLTLQEMVAMARVFALVSQAARPMADLAATLKSNLGFLKNLKED